MTERMSPEEYRRQIPKVGGRRVTPETALKHAAVQYLRLQGWLTYPVVQQGIGAVRGMPDRVAIKDTQTIWLEFKSPHGRLSPAQEERFAEMRAAGAEVYVIRSVEDLYTLDKRSPGAGGNSPGRGNSLAKGGSHGR
ncbi:MAG: VRR-NUC domain-containing protein [Armatimonadia bacterium]